MSRLVVNNAHEQLISYIISSGDITILDRFNLTPDMFVQYKDLVQRMIDFYNIHHEVPVLDTVYGWNEEFIASDDIQDSDILVRQLQIDYFYTHDFQKMLNRTVLNTQVDPEEAMKEMSEFCLKNTELIYGKVKSYKYQGDSEQEIATLEDMRNRKNVIVPTGFDAIDKSIGGLRTIKELCVVFARMNQGKSWVACMMAVAALKVGRRVLYYSGESPVEHVNYRLDTLLFGFPNDKLMKYELTDQEFQDYVELRRSNYEKYSGEIEIITPEDHLNNKKLTVGELRGILQREKYDYVIIDQLSEMDETGNKPSQNTKLKYKNITDELAHLSSEFQTPIVLMCQASRTAGDIGGEESENECPELKDIADSDDIARVCTTAISMCQPKPGELKLAVKKARFTGKNAEARYMWTINFGQIEEIDSVKGPADGIKPKRPQRTERPPRARQQEDVF